VRLDLRENSHLFALLQLLADLAESRREALYMVGGSVRDMILNRPHTDLDFAVIGDGIAFAKAFAKMQKQKRVIVYERFGTALVPARQYNIEFVSARAERYSQDSRKPSIEKADLKSDLARRDFTINALAVAIDKRMNGEVIDNYNGLSDIQRGLLRTPLAPQKTFFDDPLRILRAVRFAAQLGFNLAPETTPAIIAMRDRLEIISIERVAEEMRKMMLTKQPQVGLQLLHDHNLFAHTIPELAALSEQPVVDGYEHKDIFSHTLQVVGRVASVASPFHLRMAALLHDIAKPRVRTFVKDKGWTFHRHEEVGAELAATIMRRLRYSAEEANKCALLVQLHGRPARLAEAGKEASDSAYRRLLYVAGDQLEELLCLSEADISTKIPGKREQLLDKLGQVKKRLSLVEARDHLRNFRDPISGTEIMAQLHLSPGPEIGRIKKAIREAIISGEIDNNSDAARSYLKKLPENL
jgi:poly(A) polymerase